MSKADKHFPLDSRENCCLYLCRIISSCELCMDRLKKYNQKTAAILSGYQPTDLVPIDYYETMADQTSNIISYLANLLGDAQTSSISYFKYRNQIEKRINKGKHDIPLASIPQDTQSLLLEFNKRRNWMNHIPESLLVAEWELIRAGKQDLPTDPVVITHYTEIRKAKNKSGISSALQAPYACFFRIAFRPMMAIKPSPASVTASAMRQ